MGRCVAPLTRARLFAGANGCVQSMKPVGLPPACRSVVTICGRARAPHQSRAVSSRWQSGQRCLTDEVCVGDDEFCRRKQRNVCARGIVAARREPKVARKDPALDMWRERERNGFWSRGAGALFRTTGIAALEEGVFHGFRNVLETFLKHMLIHGIDLLIFTSL